MPAGCEFTCANVDCPHYTKGFNLTGPWPQGYIDDVIQSKRVQEDDSDLKDMLAQRKEEGRTKACINFPNDDDIEAIGFRVQKICTNCMTIFEFDVEDSENEEHVDKTCQKCERLLLNLSQASDIGISCPGCHEKMKQNRWFS